MKAVIITVLFVLLGTFVNPVVGGDDDERCKCVCKNLQDGKQSLTYIKKNTPAEQCHCEGVIGGWQNCQLCDCKHETRNTVMIKILVVLVICVIGALVVYMLFLLCLDPILHQRRNYAYRRQDLARSLSEDSLGGSGGSSMAIADRPTPGSSLRRPPEPSGASIVNRVTNQQERWKQTVAVQRENIFVKHHLLN